MNKYNILHKDYTINCRFYQLKLPLNLEYMIPSNDSVRLLSQFIEEMDLSDLYMTYSKVKENQVSPRKLLKIMLYGYMNKLYSSRDIEKACYRDINFMYLLAGSKVPDHSTFARFRSLHFAPCATRILSEVSNFLYDIGEISGEAIFIDGTKIEASSNKYTFVWKGAVTKNFKKLLIKIADFVSECNELYGIKVGYRNIIKLKDIKKLRKKLYKIKKSENIEFVHGCGKRKTALQRSIETLEKYCNKLKEYTKKIHTCGERNSYSRTDEDATFMRMKEDSMKNGQLKPAYNLQHGVDSEYITWLTIGPQPTDTTTLIPFLKSMEENLNFKYLKIVADSGYKSRKTIYACADCSQCPYKKDCIKGHNCKTPLEKRTKKIEISKKFNRQRKEDLKRITSDEGCILRMNRSIQAEGSFAQLKQDMGFRRFLSRGKENVLAESILLAIAHNINKLHAKIQSEKTGTHLHKPKEAA